MENISHSVMFYCTFNLYKAFVYVIDERSFRDKTSRKAEVHSFGTQTLKNEHFN